MQGTILRTVTERLRSLGEFGLIRTLVEGLPEAAGVLVGPGDDAAVLDASGKPLLATADILIEGAHFDLALSSYADVGYKSIAVNVSDVAAMGGRPRWALVSIGAPAATPPRDLEYLYEGIGDAAREFEIGIVGGDTVRAERLVVSISLIGEAASTPVLRSGAHAGDALVVTGPLGAASAGLALLRAAKENEQARAFLGAHPELARAHRRAQARVAAGRALALAGAHAMIDVSDGFCADVGHICEASGVGVLIDDVPLAPGVEGAARILGIEAVRFALAGGDDYELAAAIETPLPGALVAGRFTEEPGVRLASGAPVPAGWDHFRA
jgi:thiamine-monophosphate kinase